MAKKYIFLYVPNIIGYVRLILVAVSYYYISTDPKWFLILYCASMILDGFDGVAARMLDQVTTFGAWFDVVIDNLSRGMLWCYVNQWGWLISCFEWLVFVCTHSLGKQWKHLENSTPPVWVQAVMADGFKTPIGAFAILGLDGLPIWIYLQKNNFLGYTDSGVVTPCVKAYFLIALIIGRLLCMTVEMWFIFNHITAMAAWDQLEEPLQDPDDKDAGDGDDDSDDFNENGDDVYQEDVDDNFSKDMKPMPPSSKDVQQVTRRQKGPSSHPTPGSTMINMGLSSQQRRVLPSKSPRGRKKSLHHSRKPVPKNSLQGPPRASSALHSYPRERPKTGDSAGFRGRRFSEDVRRRRPPPDVYLVGPDSDKKEPIPRRLETDNRSRMTSNDKNRRERSKSPREKQSPKGSAQQKSASPIERETTQKLPHHERTSSSLIVTHADTASTRKEPSGARLTTDVHQKNQEQFLGTRTLSKLSRKDTDKETHLNKEQTTTNMEENKDNIEETFKDAIETSNSMKENIQDNEETVEEVKEETMDSSTSDKAIPQAPRKSIFNWLTSRGKKKDKSRATLSTTSVTTQSESQLSATAEGQDSSERTKDAHQIPSQHQQEGLAVIRSTLNSKDTKSSSFQKIDQCLPQMLDKQQKQQAMIPTFQGLAQLEDEVAADRVYQNDEQESLSTQYNEGQSIFEWIGESRVKKKRTTDKKEHTQEHKRSKDHTYSSVKVQNLSLQLSNDQELEVNLQDKRQSIFEWLADLVKPNPADDIDESKQEQKSSLDNTQSKSSVCDREGSFLHDLTDKPLQKRQSLIPTFQDLPQAGDDEEVDRDYQNEKEYSSSQREKRQSIFQWIGETRVTTDMPIGTNCGTEGQTILPEASSSAQDIKSKPISTHNKQKRQSLIPTFQDLPQVAEEADQEYPNEREYSSSQREKRQSIFEWIGETRVTTDMPIDTNSVTKGQTILPEISSSAQDIKSKPISSLNIEQKRQSLIPTFQDLPQAGDDEEADQEYPNEEEYSSSQHEKRQSIFEWIGEPRIKAKHSNEEHTKDKSHATLSTPSTDPLQKLSESSSSQQETPPLHIPLTEQSTESTHQQQLEPVTISQLKDLEESQKEQSNLPASQDKEHLQNDNMLGVIKNAQLNNTREGLENEVEIFEDSVENLTNIKDVKYNEDIFEDSVEKLNLKKDVIKEKFEDAVESPTFMKGYVQDMVKRLEEPNFSLDTSSIEETFEDTIDEGDPSTSFEADPQQPKKKRFNWLNRNKKKTKSGPGKVSIPQNFRESARNG